MRSTASRRLWIAAACTLAGLLLTGCTPRQVGNTGIGVDAAGDPIVYAAVCDDQITSVSILVEDTGPTVTRWSGGPVTAGDVVVIPLNTPPKGWQVEKGPTALEPGVRYEAAGWRASAAVTKYVLFDTARLARLKTGEILYSATGGGTATAKSVEDFQRAACLRS
jgi:hypothetical protein